MDQAAVLTSTVIAAHTTETMPSPPTTSEPPYPQSYTRSTEQGDQQVQQLLSDYAAHLVFTAASYILPSVAVFAVLANIVNVRVYWAMGFATVSNMNFFCLSIMDLFSSLFMILQGLSVNPLLARAKLMISINDLTILLCPIFWSCSALGSWMTAIVSMERCCCVVFPLKVHRIFTPRLVVGLIIGMIVYQVFTATLHFFAMELRYVTLAGTNETRLILDSAYYNQRLAILSQVLSYSIPTMLCFVLVLIGTIFLVVKLRQSLKFRVAAAASASKVTTSRETRMVQTIVVICTIYIVCLSPNVGLFLTSLLYPSFHIFHPYLGNATYAILGLSLMFQVVSLSANIFVYLKLSTAYRNACISVFSCK